MKESPSASLYMPTLGPFETRGTPLPTERCSLLQDTQIDSQDSLAPRCVIHQTGCFRLYWDLFIILLCIYNSISVPLSVAFQLVGDRQDDVIQEIDYSFDLLFFLDLLLNLFTTFSTPSGIEVLNLSQIQRHYVKSGNFWLDLLAVIPFDGIVEWSDAGIHSTSLKAVRCLKLIRLFRLRRLISLLKLHKDLKIILKIVIVLYFLFLFIHIFSCLWALLNNGPEDYLPPNEIGRFDFYYRDDLLVYRYWVSFYYVILMLLGADTVAFNTAQCVFAAFVLIVGSMITAVLFGQITALVMEMNSRSANMQEIMENTNDIMISLKLPKDLVSLVNEFLSRTHNYRKKQSNLQQFFKMVPEDLKKQVIRSVFDTAVSGCGLFQGEMYEKVMQNLEIMHTTPEETVVRRGAVSDKMYIVSTGELLVTACNSLGEDNVNHELSAGMYFGEVGVLLSSRRTATVTALNYCVLAVLPASSFHRISTPTLRTHLREHIYLHYRESWREFVLSSLKSLPLFSSIPDLDLVLLAFQSQTLRLAAGTLLHSPDSIPTSIYILLSGELELDVDIRIHGESMRSIRFTRGTVCFGTSAVYRHPQNCRVTVSKDAVVVKLDREVVEGRK